MKPYTALGICDSGEVFCHHIEALTPSDAFNTASQKQPSGYIVSILDGHVSEGKGIYFCGDHVVETKMLQKNIRTEHTQENTKSPSINCLADVNMQDWKVTQSCEANSVPAEHRDTYRCVVEISIPDNQIYFKVYPASLDQISTELTQNGISGLIEIRNGKPAISIGLHESELPIHIESDVMQGIYIHSDSGTSPNIKPLYSESHQHYFNCQFYKCCNPDWLDMTRRELAELHYAAHDFGENIPIDDSGWETMGDDMSRIVFFENPAGGDSLKGRFLIRFHNDSIQIKSKRYEIPTHD